MHRLQGEHLENEDVEGSLEEAGGGGWHATRTDILYEVGAGHKSEAKYRLLETPVPFQGCIGILGVDFSEQVDKVAFGAGSDVNEICHARLRSRRKTPSPGGPFPF